MGKKAISITLGRDNLTWLKARTGATGVRSVSELLDRLVTGARASGKGPVRSVVGTIDIDSSDPHLDEADHAVRHLFDLSLKRPLVARESTPKYAADHRSRKKRRA